MCDTKTTYPAVQDWAAIANVQDFFEAPLTENFRQMFETLRNGVERIRHSTSMLIAAVEHKDSGDRGAANYQAVQDSYNKQLRELADLCVTMSRIAQNILPRSP